MDSGLLSTVTTFILRLLGRAPEIPSPPNFIPWANIELNDNGDVAELVIKNIPKPIMLLSCDFNTNSMDGAFDIGHSSLLVSNREFIEKWAHPGTWISYSLMDAGQPIGRLHQIFEESYDDIGWYCIARGLNNGYNDPWKIRLDNIQAVVMMAVWTENIKGKSLYLSS